MNKQVLALGILAVVGIVVFGPLRSVLMPEPKVETVVEYVEREPAAEIPEINMVDILTASRDIQIGERIMQRDLVWKDWPQDSLSEQFITINNQPDAAKEFIGSVAKSPIFNGEPVSARKLVNTGDRSVMSALLSPGMRAVTTRISVASAAGGFIKPGDHVDIILTRRVTNQLLDGSTEEQSVASTIFENVRVMAIDQTYQSGAEGAATVIGSTATFELNQGDAEYLQETASQGDITLTLRSLHNSGGRPVRSAARVDRAEEEKSSMIVVRRGQMQQVGLSGR